MKLRDLSFALPWTKIFKSQGHLLFTIALVTLCFVNAKASECESEGAKIEKLIQNMIFDVSGQRLQCEQWIDPSVDMAVLEHVYWNLGQICNVDLIGLEGITGYASSSGLEYYKTNIREIKAMVLTGEYNVEGIDCNL